MQKLLSWALPGCNECAHFYEGEGEEPKRRRERKVWRGAGGAGPRPRAFGLAELRALSLLLACSKSSASSSVAIIPPTTSSGASLVCGISRCCSVSTLLATVHAPYSWLQIHRIHPRKVKSCPSAVREAGKGRLVTRHSSPSTFGAAREDSSSQPSFGIARRAAIVLDCG